MKQLYVVTIEQEIVVVAESAVQAESIANNAHEDSYPDYRVVPMSFMPMDWDNDSIVYGNNDKEEYDRTLGQWLALGAAPDYMTMKDRLTALVAKKSSP